MNRHLYRTFRGLLKFPKVPPSNRLQSLHGDERHHEDGVQVCLGPPYKKGLEFRGLGFRGLGFRLRVSGLGLKTGNPE